MAARQQLLDERAAQLEHRAQLIRLVGLLAKGGGFRRGTLRRPDRVAARRLLAEYAARLQEGSLTTEEVQDLARLVAPIWVEGRRLTGLNTNPKLTACGPRVVTP